MLTDKEQTENRMATKWRVIKVNLNKINTDWINLQFLLHMQLHCTNAVTNGTKVFLCLFIEKIKNT